MILTVTPNTTLDHAYVVYRLDRGERLLALKETECVGGKGGLLSAFAADMGARSVALGFAAGENGKKLAGLLRRRHVRPDFSPAQGETRRVITIVEYDHDGETLLLPASLRCSRPDESDLMRRTERWLPKSTWLALCGSLAPGCKPDLYAKLVRSARRFGVLVLIDSRGEALHWALAERPTVVKLNLAELALTMRRRLTTQGEIVKALLNLLDRGVELAVCTLGAQGAVAVTARAQWQVKPPRIESLNATGAGDAFAAGLLVAREKGEDWAAALRWAVAAGTAKALEWPTDGMQVRNVRSLVRGVTVKKL